MRPGVNIQVLKAREGASRKTDPPASGSAKPVSADCNADTRLLRAAVTVLLLPLAGPWSPGGPPLRGRDAELDDAALWTRSAARVKNNSPMPPGERALLFAAGGAGRGGGSGGNFGGGANGSVGCTETSGRRPPSEDLRLSSFAFSISGSAPQKSRSSSSSSRAEARPA